MRIIIFKSPINNYQNKVKCVEMERLAISLVSEKTNFTGQRRGICIRYVKR